MAFNIEENVMQEIQDIINKAIIDQDARTVDFYHCMKEYVETNEQIKFFTRLNQPRLRSMIEYLKNKLSFLQSRITSYEIQFE